MAQGLTVRAVEAARVLAHLGRINAPRSNSSGLTAEELSRRGITYAVEEGGEVVGAYNLQLAEHDTARVAWIMAAGGHRPGVDLTDQIYPAIEAQARALGATSVAFNTKRKGLVAKMEKLGFTVTSVTLRKPLK